MRDPSKIVATARIISLDPERMIGTHALGEDWCKVYIIQLHVCDEKLIRPHSMLKTIRDAHGSPIAWPVSLVCAVVSILIFLIKGYLF
jgi:hypothetical protein